MHNRHNDSVDEARQLAARLGLMLTLDALRYAIIAPAVPLPPECPTDADDIEIESELE